MKESQIILEHNSVESKSNVYEAKWIPSSSRFISVGCCEENNKHGHIQMYKVNVSDDFEKLTTIKTDSPIKSCTFDSSPSNIRHLSVGDFSGKLSIFDLENSKTILSIQSHSTIINKIDGAGYTLGTTEICSASRDGDVKIWDTRQSKSPVFVHSSKIDCWSVAFGNSYSDTERMLACGYKNGDLILFDLRKTEPLLQINKNHGIPHLEFQNKESQFSSLNYGNSSGKLGILNTKEQVNELEVSKTTIWNLSHIPQNSKYFLAADGSGQISICQHLDGSKVKILQKKFISNLGICSIDFHRDIEGLFLTTGFDKNIKLFSMKKF